MDAIRQIITDSIPTYHPGANHKVFLSRKKMKSIKDETDQLYGIIHKFENATKEAESISKEVSSVLLCSSVFISPPSASQSP